MTSLFLFSACLLSSGQPPQAPSTGANAEATATVANSSAPASEAAPVAPSSEPAASTVAALPVGDSATPTPPRSDAFASPTPQAATPRSAATKARRWGDITPAWRLDGVLEYRAVVNMKRNRDTDERPRDWAYGVTIRTDFRLAKSKFFAGAAVGIHRREAMHIYGQAASTNLESTRIPVHVRVVLRPIDGIDVYVQAGPSINATWFFERSVDVGVNYVSMKRQQVRLAGEVVAGTSIYLPRAWLSRHRPSHATFGLDLNAGAAFGPNYPIELKGKEDAANPIAPLDLGTVKTGGFTLNLGMFVRFM